MICDEEQNKFATLRFTLPGAPTYILFYFSTEKTINDIIEFNSMCTSYRTGHTVSIGWHGVELVPDSDFSRALWFGCTLLFLIGAARLQVPP